MNFGRVFELIYSEKDPWNLFALIVLVGSGVAWYIYSENWEIAIAIGVLGFMFTKGLIIFTKKLVSNIRSFRSRKHSEDKELVKKQSEKTVEEQFQNLGHGELAVVEAFVHSGGCVLLWTNAMETPGVSEDGIEALIERKLIRSSETTVGGRVTLVLDTELFDYARQVMLVESW